MSEAAKTPEPQAEQNVAAVEQQPQQQAADASPQVEKKTPGKRTRLSFIERAQKESEELVKNLGGSLEMEGGRRTRSSARGTPTRPVATPPPAKKSRNSPASPKAATPRGRGRGRKLETSVTPEPPESKAKTEPEAEKDEAKEAPAAEKEAVEPEEKSAEVAKSKETNGPEKAEAEAEHVDEAPEKVEQPVVPAVVEDKPAAAVVAAAEESKPTADQVDASKSETVQQAITSQSAPATEAENLKQSVNVDEPAAEPAVIAIADSPMEVDEQSNSVAASSKANEETAAPVVEVEAAKASEPSIEAVVAEKPAEPVKEPTPEPMEVDSSSKSSDVVECTEVDKAEEEKAATTPNDVQSTNSHDDKPAAAEVELPTTPAAENNLKSEINANLTANDIPAAIKSIEEPVAVGEPHVDNNKNENDVDQQKLAASQLNAASGAGDAPVNAIPTSL